MARGGGSSVARGSGSSVAHGRGSLGVGNPAAFGLTARYILVLGAAAACGATLAFGLAATFALAAMSIGALAILCLNGNAGNAAGLVSPPTGSSSDTDTGLSPL